MATLAVRRSSVQQRVINGVLGGLAGGLVFGMLMGMMGMLPMVAMLVKSESALVGFGVHMLISALIGAGFGVAVGDRVRTLAHGLALGAGYGLVWWVLGPLLLMPLLLGMAPQFGSAFEPMLLKSLMGHMLFGIISGGVYAWLQRH